MKSILSSKSLAQNVPKLLKTEWNCARFTPFTPFHTQGREALILLNFALPQDTDSYWKTDIKICADGGAQRLFQHNKTLLPDFIVGDFDSTPDQVLNYYRQREVTIRHSSCQESTDLEKSLALVREKEQSNGSEYDTLILLGGLGGCMGHSFANINALFSCSQRKVVLVGPESIGFLVWPGETTIHRGVAQLKSCNLIPLGGPCQVSTQGLKWDLQEQRLSFGGLVSTSNEMAADQILISTDQPFLWILDFIKDTPHEDIQTQE